jgi:hypothetical protein
MKHSPATALPWKTWDRGIGYEIHSQDDFPVNDETRECFNQTDAAFIVHAANAYGPLVEALRNLLADADPDSQNSGSQVEARALLRSLGEAE